MTKNTYAVTFGMRLLYGGGVIGWGYEISCVLGREGVYMGVYCANLSFVEFRTMILGIHVYVYIGYMVIDTQ